MSRRSRLLLEDIVESCEKLVRFSEDRVRHEFFGDPMRLDAALFNLHVLGEAVKKLPNELRETYPEVPWREIAGMRDVIAHTYFALDESILWSAIREDVPALLSQVRRILEVGELPD